MSAPFWPSWALAPASRRRPLPCSTGSKTSSGCRSRAKIYWNWHELRYTRYDGSTWQRQVISTSESAYSDISLALDAGDRPHITCSTQYYQDLWYVSLCDPITAAEISGPRTLLSGETGWYSATATPLTASLPIAFVWDNGTFASTAPYSWTTVGVHTITVTATNGCGTVQADLTVTVECNPIESVAITGPDRLWPGQQGFFTATYAPLSATLPVTLSWDGGTLGPSAAYSWTLPGAYTVTVTATNGCGMATGRWAVEVQPREHRVYLPLIIR